MCIYEKKQEHFQFTALVTKELTEAFHQAFARYKASTTQVGEIDPVVVKEHLQKTINEFFNDLSGRVR